MKLILTDTSGGDHELDQVIFGLATDIHNLGLRIKHIEDETGITYQRAEQQAITDAEETDGSSTSAE